MTDARSTEVAAGDHPDKAATPAATRARLDPDIAARLQQYARGPDTGATFHKAYATALASLDADEQGEVAAMLPEAVMGARLGVGGKEGVDTKVEAKPEAAMEVKPKAAMETKPAKVGTAKAAKEVKPKAAMEEPAKVSSTTKAGPNKAEEKPSTTKTQDDVPKILLQVMGDEHVDLLNIGKCTTYWNVRQDANVNTPTRYDSHIGAKIEYNPVNENHLTFTFTYKDESTNSWYIHDWELVYDPIHQHLCLDVPNVGNCVSHCFNEHVEFTDNGNTMKEYNFITIRWKPTIGFDWLYVDEKSDPTRYQEIKKMLNLAEAERMAKSSSPDVSKTHIDWAKHMDDNSFPPWDWEIDSS